MFSLEHQDAEQLSPETQNLRWGPNCMGPALKALECNNVHVRVPEIQHLGRPFPIALLLSLWEARTLDWMRHVCGSNQGGHSETSHRKYPIVCTGSVLNSLQLLLEAQDELWPVLHGRNVELLAFIQDLVHRADLTSSA